MRIYKWLLYCLNNNNNNCLKSNIQCIEIRVQWTVHLGSSHMHVHAVTRVHAVTPKLVIYISNAPGSLHERSYNWNGT